jgi:hypothetical protein
VRQADFAQDWERSFAYIRKARDVCEQTGCIFVLATYPYGVQISPKEWAYGRHHFGFGDDKIYSREPMQLLAEFAASEGILFIDATPAFLNATRHPLYFPYDGHFTIAGQKVYGDVLAEFVQQKVLNTP